MSDFLMDDFGFEDQEPARPIEVEFDQAKFDDLILQLAQGTDLDMTYDLRELYPAQEPDITELDTQEIQIDAQAMDAWLDDLATNGFSDLDF
jgi:hypothetical protein